MNVIYTPINLPVHCLLPDYPPTKKLYIDLYALYLLMVKFPLFFNILGENVTTGNISMCVHKGKYLNKMI